MQMGKCLNRVRNIAGSESKILYLWEAVLFPYRQSLVPIVVYEWYRPWVQTAGTSYKEQHKTPSAQVETLKITSWTYEGVHWAAGI